MRQGLIEMDNKLHSTKGTISDIIYGYFANRKYTNEINMYVILTSKSSIVRYL